MRVVCFLVCTWRGMWNAPLTDVAYRLARFEPGSVGDLGSMIALGQPQLCLSINVGLTYTPAGAQLFLDYGSSGGLARVSGPVMAFGSMK